MEWLLERNVAGLFLKPGLKKTSITLKALSTLKKAGLMKHALVVAPLRVCAVTWPGEVKKWKDFHGLSWVFLHGDNKDLELEQDVDVYLINHDGLDWLFEGNRFKQKKFDTLVIDESSKFRNTRTLRFKMLKRVLLTFKRRWILTGTPSPRSYLDLFGQIYILDLGKALGKFITHFRINYFTPLDRNGWRWELKRGAKEMIEELIAPYVLVLEAKDVNLKEPEQVPNIIRVELPKQVRELYDELEEDLITYIDGRVPITAVNLGVLYGKCAQIANGGIYHPREPGIREPRKWTNVHDAKIVAVKELLRTLTTPALVVYDYAHDLSRLQKAFPRAPRIGGGVNMATSIQLVEKWNASQIPLMLVHAKAMSHGLNMQFGKGNNVIWHSIPDDFEDYEQLNYRIGRDGANYGKYFTHHIVARDTVDEVKMRRLRKKDRSQSGLLAGLKIYAKNRSIKRM